MLNILKNDETKHQQKRKQNDKEIRFYKTFYHSLNEFKFRPKEMFVKFNFGMGTNGNNLRKERV